MKAHFTTTARVESLEAFGYYQAGSATYCESAARGGSLLRMNLLANPVPSSPNHALPQP
jgi:hypothetical protein